MPIDPETARRLRFIAGIPSMDAVAADPALQERVAQYVERPPGYGAPACRVRKKIVEGNGHRVPIRAYRPFNLSNEIGTLVWLHGGAFQFGDLDMPEADTVARELVQLAGVEVVTVDYRLVDTTVRYPLPLQDVVTVWRWMASEATKYGGTRTMWLGGVSAGATLAVSTALHLRDSPELPRPSRLLLVSPALHRKLPPLSRPLARKMAAVPPLARFDGRRCADMFSDYLGPEPVEPYGVPAECELEGMPPVAMVNAEYDDLRASGEAFASQLRAAKVPVEMRTEPGVIHGHLNEDPRLPGMALTLAYLAGVLTADQG